MWEELVLMSSENRKELIVMAFSLKLYTPKQVYEMYKPLYTLEELEAVYKEVTE